MNRPRPFLSRSEVFISMSEEKKNAAEEAVEETKAPEAEAPATEATPEAAPEATEEQTPEEAREEAAEESVIEEEVQGEAVELPYRDLKPGMFVRVHERIVDVNSKGETKQRTQIFEGLLIGLRGAGISRSMTVRKNAKGWMVEKIFPLSSPNVEKVEVVKQYKTRRAKLSYLRGRFKRKLRDAQK